ncbi:TPA: hypothetical protein ACPJVB_001640, partial [Haemophilus influenzae]
SSCRVGFSPPTNNREIFWWAEAHPTLSTHHSMRASFYFRSNHKGNSVVDLTVFRVTSDFKVLMPSLELR